MTNSVIQTSFNAGEWAPSLYSRVDLAKYHSGAALLRNFFVDYRGGATIRPGTKYVLQTRLPTAVRLIPFQASFTVSYVLEFGQGYIRFYNQGQPILENSTSISAINIGTSTITDTAHGYANGDWILINSIVGSVGTRLNGNYFIIAGATANTYTLTDLNGNPIVLSGAYTSGGTAQRVYTLLNSPYQAADLEGIKFAQNVNVLVLCHPNYAPQQLVLNSATNWTLSAITFGSTIPTPTGQTVTTTLGAGSVNYAYLITAVDANGQESAPSAPATLASVLDIRNTPGTNFVGWSAVTGAVSYNVYRANPCYSSPVPVGADFGFVGNVTHSPLIDSNIVPDFSQSPPIPENPFQGTGVQTISLTASGANYTSVPTVTLTAAPGGGTTAQAYCYLSLATISINGSGAGYDNFNTGLAVVTLANGIILTVNIFNGHVTQIDAVNNRGAVTSGSPPTLAADLGNGNNTVGGFIPATFNVTYLVSFVALSNPGTGYIVAPSVSFSASGGGGAAATTMLGAPGSGNPSVPGFFQQRLVLAGPVLSPQQFNMSQPGSYYNFNTHFPLQPDDAIQDTLVSGTLNTIQSMISQPQGLIMLADRQAWLLNGGGAGTAISATGLVANVQAYNGASFPPPIVANDNILYIQAKGSIVRDLVFNFYTQVYTGTDISVLSSHLFYGFSLIEWAWAEEPFKLVWAVRNDGTLLSLTFLKEQEMIAWAHSDTQGAFKSVATVVESTNTTGNVDAIYTVVQRTINGNTIQYVERLSEITYPNGLASSWNVDAGINFTGPATLTFTGAQHLAGMQVTGIATTDGTAPLTSAITPFTMPTNGTFTLPAPTNDSATGYTYVLIGLAYSPQLITLPLDLGEPTVQGKRKKIGGVTLRVKDALGLSMGRTISSALPLADLTVGNVGSMTNQIVTNLVTGDARGYSDPLWDVPGQYAIIQTLPYPATVLGVIPEIEIGDKDK